ncbi:sulfate adenylyltransferase subunit CysN [Endozoicomonas euniceicola]|uniref:Sulfate adenylyltransferase subunit 1 n=1 Tax=Endozoicomonas euniceicola TaxID=1234143 RepID=A0ABY6H164_9GAMM|nr:sulfate adenylyltransferase subunit CysN [Endozoicomonas euniceicola]UYM18542.1 sulfate adenylyltransferase subunit CysN [Endozoicomonas euniceicola]
MNQSELIEKDILGYLKQHESKDMLRFLTCGNVDDGKSTLIGRLLHDSKMIFEDQLGAIKNDSKKFNTTDQEFDLALLVDGLQSEREQGITIDVAYRYFSTEKRKFIIADCPGHEQYTRNMATGASNCDLAIILIDARYGVQTQTKRHSFIASLLGIKHIVVAVNKMDLVDYSQDRFREIKAEYKEFADQLNLSDIRFVPISALCGDNVVESGENMPWYPGATLMKLLETVTITDDLNTTDFRLPVQYVNRPNLDFRGFCGTVAAGKIHKGDAVTALPSGKQSTVKTIHSPNGEVEEAFVGQAITLTLDDEIDVSRGDMLVNSDHLPEVSEAVEAHIVWMSEQAMVPGREYALKFATKSTFGRIESIEHRVDVNTLEQQEAHQLALNEIGLCRVVANAPIVFDKYDDVRGSGNFIVIDRMTNVTVGAGMITGKAGEAKVENREITPERMKEFEVKMNALVREYFPHWEAVKIEL